MPSPVPTPDQTSNVTPELTARLRRLLHHLDERFLERRGQARAALLALLAGQHVLLLGPPGTGKSMLARALCACFRVGRGEAVYFEYLLSRFTHPDELFGPVSIPGLKLEDYRRLTDGFLPRAHIAFLDEVFKANSAILNSLLTLVNERVFHHGRHRDPVPLVGLIGASNELPDPESGLAALFDRFLVRVTVPPVGDEAAFRALTTRSFVDAGPDEADALGIDELPIIARAADRVVIPEPVTAALVELWKHAGISEWGVSDRRWRQAAAMLRVAAATDGRDTVDRLDLLLLEPVLAPTPDAIAEVREIILHQFGEPEAPKHALRPLWSRMAADRRAPADAGSPGGWIERVARRREEVDRFLTAHADAVRVLAADRRRLESVAVDHLWLDGFPPRLLAPHIEAARDLARILSVAEAYRDALTTPARTVTALMDSLPEGTRRVYGHDSVCMLEIGEAEIYTGLTLAGEHVRAARPESGRGAGLPTVQVTATAFLEWVDGRGPADALLANVPAWAARNAVTALEAVRRLLGANPVPRPPELPEP